MQNIKLESAFDCLTYKQLKSHNISGQHMHQFKSQAQLNEISPD